MYQLYIGIEGIHTSVTHVILLVKSLCYLCIFTFLYQLNETNCVRTVCQLLSFKVKQRQLERPVSLCIYLKLDSVNLIISTTNF